MMTDVGREAYVWQVVHVGDKAADLVHSHQAMQRYVDGLMGGLRAQYTKEQDRPGCLSELLTCCLPSLSGRSTATRLSKRPGRRSAWSSTSGLLVAAMQITTLSCRHSNQAKHKIIHTFPKCLKSLTQCLMSPHAGILPCLARGMWQECIRQRTGLQGKEN